jgi:hypothetical protein
MARVQPRICPTCKREFRPPRSRVICCSKRCKTLAQWDHTPAEQTTPFKRYGDCSHCQKRRPIVGRGLCQQCFRKPEIRRLYVCGKPGRPRTLPTERNCAFCNSVFPISVNRGKQRYCSQRCSGLAKATRDGTVYGRPLLTREEQTAALEQHRGLIFFLAKRLWRTYWHPYHGSFADLVDECRVGAFIALSRWDAKRESRMTIGTYLFRAMKRHIQQEIKKARQRIPIDFTAALE